METENFNPGSMRVPAGSGGRSSGRARDKYGPNTPFVTENDKVLRTLQVAESTTNFGIMGLFFAPMVGGVLAGGADKFKWKKTAAVIRNIFMAPFNALNETRWGERDRLGARFMDAVAHNAKESGLDEWEKSARATAERMHGRADARAALKEAAKSVNAATSVEANLAKFGADNSAGRGMTGALEWVANKRIDASHSRYAKNIAKLEQHFTKPMPGFWGSIKNFFTRKKTLPYSGNHFDGIIREVNTAKLIEDPAKRAEALGKIPKMIEDLKLPKEISRRGDKISMFIQRSMSNMHAVGDYEHMIANGLKGLYESSGRIISRVPLLGALAAAGAAAGVGVAVLEAHDQGREAKQALDNLTRAVGDANHPIVLEAAKIYNKQGMGRATGAVFNSAGQIANGVMLANPASMGAGAMLGAFVLPMAAGLFQLENPFLNAFNNLQQEEAGKLKLTHEQKVYFVKLLVGVVPGVAQHGGQNNKLAGPVAEAIVAKNLGADATMKLLANPEAFMALANEVNAQQLEKQHAKDKANVANENTAAAAPHVAAAAAPMEAAKPATKVKLAAGKEHERLEMAQQALAQ